MATLVARWRTDGSVAHRVQWRLVGTGPWQSETFDDKRAAAKFQTQVEAHGTPSPICPYLPAGIESEHRRVARAGAVLHGASLFAVARHVTVWAFRV